MDFDLAIVGAGTTGCAIARHLARFDLKIALVEAAEDVAAGASRANSAIVHAGFDAKPGSLMARLNVRGNAVFESWCRELSIPFNRCGSLVSAFTPDDEATLRDLLARGEANGVPGLRIVSGDEARALEPRLSKEALSALWAPTAAIACPYEFCIACAENARANGAVWKLGAQVSAMLDRENAVELETAAGETFRARFVVDAAGVFADDVAQMLGDDSFSIHARKGEYLLLDRAAAPLLRVLFPCPTKLGKGILVSPTVDGNTFAGPTAVDQESKTDTSVTAEGIATLKKAGLKSVPDLDFRKAITLFAGLRAQPSEGDFVIRRSAACPRLVLAAGICSPGFTSAPAIAETVEGLLAEAGLELRSRADWNPKRERPVPFRRMDDAQRAAAIAANPLHGRIVCRCETVTEAEIVDAIRRGATTLDAVKRRTRAGMGRCQGGFCSPRVMEILARELARPYPALTKDGGGSRLVVGATRAAAAGKYAGAQHDIASEASPVIRGAAAPVIASEASPVVRHSAADDGDGGEAADVAIVGGGPAGLAAAVAARKARPDARVVVPERDTAAGGILRQCIHNGFGLHHFGEELTGPEYAGRFVKQAEKAGAELWTDTMVLSVTKDREVVCMNPARGLVRLRAGAVVLAMGCRERTRGALSIPGTRPAGVYTAGCAQRLVNMEGFLPGRKVVILGSGDIGLIMARRMTWEGAEVKLVAEIMPYSSGLNRNIVQCLVDNGIPLKFNHTVVRILGKERVEGVVVAEVDPATRAPIPGTEETIECDTLLLSVGLLPENELTTAAGVALDPVTGGAAADQTRQTSVPGVFACGNVLHVHDLVDNVTAESLLAGEAAAIFATGEGLRPSPSRAVRGAGAVRYVVPQRVAADAEGKIDLYFRVGSVQKPAVCEVRCGGVAIATRRKPVMTPGEMEKITVDAAKISDDIEVFVSSPESAPRTDAVVSAQGAAPGETTMTCICCPMGCTLRVAPKKGGGWTVTGNGCPRGAKYAIQEMESPERVVTSTVRVEGGAAPLVAAKTASPIPKSSIPACLAAIRALAVPAPVVTGQVLAPDLADTGIALVATSES